MKKFVLPLLCGLLISSTAIFAFTDTDNDGVQDEKDLCPHVYSRSETGCPTLTKAEPLPKLNICYQEQKNIIIVRFQPICDPITKICPVISSLSGAQICDPIFPLILQDGKPFIRGGIHILGFTH